MSEDKNSFIFYHDFLSKFEMLPDESERWKLLDAIVHFSSSGEIPTGLSPAAEMAFCFMKDTIARDQKKYLEKVAKNRENGKKGGRPKKEEDQSETGEPDGYSENPTVISETQKNQGLIPKPKKPDSDSDSDSDSGTDSDPVSNKKHIVEQTRPCIPFEEIVSFLNEETGKAFKHDTKSTRQKIKARFQQGFNLEDFKTVISYKVKKWENNPNFMEFLRPDTLFGTKFESYLQASRIATPNQNCADCYYLKNQDCKGKEATCQNYRQI